MLHVVVLPGASSHPQANDRTFKEDWLGAVADTSSWAAAKAKSLEALKATKAAQQRLAAQVELLQQQATAAEVQVEQLGREEAAWAAQRQLRLVSGVALLSVGSCVRVPGTS
jgi:hypothetical protein